MHIILVWPSSFRNSARFLWKRIPAPVKQNNLELIAAWKIVKCLWAHGHAAVHEALRSYSWSPEVQQVISAVAGKHHAVAKRMRT